MGTSQRRLERSWSQLGELSLNHVFHHVFLFDVCSMVLEVSRGAPEHLERLLEACLALLELSWELLRPLGGVLKPLGSLLGSSWSHLGASWRLYEWIFMVFSRFSCGFRAQDPPIKPDQVVRPESTDVIMCLRPCNHLPTSCNHLPTSCNHLPTSVQSSACVRAII